MYIDRDLASMSEAEQLVLDAHEARKEHVKPVEIRSPKGVSVTKIAGK